MLVLLRTTKSKKIPSEKTFYAPNYTRLQKAEYFPNESSNLNEILDLSSKDNNQLPKKFHNNLCSNQVINS